MAVKIDHPTMWRIDCDSDTTCHHRLYLYCANEQVAAQRAVDEYGWFRDGDRVWCREHGRVTR